MMANTALIPEPPAMHTMSSPDGSSPKRPSGPDSVTSAPTRSSPAASHADSAPPGTSRMKNVCSPGSSDSGARANEYGRGLSTPGTRRVQNWPAWPTGASPPHSTTTS